MSTSPIEPDPHAGEQRIAAEPSEDMFESVEPDFPDELEPEPEPGPDGPDLGE